MSARTSWKIQKLGAFYLLYTFPSLKNITTHARIYICNFAGRHEDVWDHPAGYVQIHPFLIDLYVQWTVVDGGDAVDYNSRRPADIVTIASQHECMSRPGATQAYTPVYVYTIAVMMCTRMMCAREGQPWHQLMRTYLLYLRCTIFWRLSSPRGVYEIVCKCLHLPTGTWSRARSTTSTCARIRYCDDASFLKENTGHPNKQEYHCWGTNMQPPTFGMCSRRFESASWKVPTNTSWYWRSCTDRGCTRCGWNVTVCLPRIEMLIALIMTSFV